MDEAVLGFFIGSVFISMELRKSDYRKKSHIISLYTRPAFFSLYQLSVNDDK